MRKSSMSLLALIVLALLGSACGGSAEEYEYQFIDNGCDTGKHTFSSKAPYCAALLDDALNHNCASAMRQARYDEACP